tara:strand:+ start:5772 stop:6185 length:414 start_codon:yes stop_codon:yes gene_type:complete
MPITPPVQIFPNDLNPSMGIGINLPFNTPGVFSSNYQTKDAIKNNLINFLLTNQGEIYLNPNFGGSVRDFLFRQSTPSNNSDVENYIRDLIKDNFPNLIIEQLFAIEEDELHQISINIKYQVANTNINDSVEIEFNL